MRRGRAAWGGVSPERRGGGEGLHGAACRGEVTRVSRSVSARVWRPADKASKLSSARTDAAGCALPLLRTAPRTAAQASQTSAATQRQRLRGVLPGSRGVLPGSQVVLPGSQGGLARVAGSLARVTGGLARVAGSLARVTGGLARVAGGLARVTGGLAQAAV
eukprot:366341-Chlamydomonas_euryale.AAC.21